MKVKVEQILLIFLVSLSFFRVNLLGGITSFLVTPQLFLSAVLIVLFFLSFIKKTEVPKPVLYFSLLLMALVVYFIATICWGYNGVLQFKRLFLFFEIILTTIAFLFLFNKLPQLKKEYILRKWIKYAITTHLIWIVIQITFFANGLHFYNDSWEIWRFINPLPHTVGPYVPRLEGGFLDPNVTGFFFSFLYFLGKKLKINSRKNDCLMILFVLLTISRSAIAAFLICLVIFRFSFLKIKLKKFYKAVSYFLLFMSMSIFTVYYFGFWGKIVSAVSARFSDNTSSSIHGSLIELGISETFKSFKTFFFGSGFASSPYFAYDLLKRIGNQWKYANFHSEYVSMFFEVGIIGFLGYYFILFYPFIHSGRVKFSLLPILLLMLLQGIFYQQYNFHYYWIILAVVLSLNLNNNAVKIEK